ncbi:hypothetical protein FACS1894187_20340 [Synergistales bacterium]|nr:hypothetical protein FACS1894187_20340 [Synergistales bacterium]
MPNLAAKRDYSKKPEVADPEHSSIGGKSNKGGRISDICLSLYLTDGDVSRAIFLIEQQDKKNKDLPLRMFQSWYRASDKYNVPVTSLAIYTGTTKPANTYTKEWQGTSVNFIYNAYSVAEADEEMLERDDRLFALPVLAAKRMLDARGKAEKRERYSLELLDLIKARELEAKKAWSFQNFVYRILRIGEQDIDPKVKGVWKMRFRPIDDVVKDIYLRYAREEGLEEGREEGREAGLKKGKFEVARSMLAEGLSADIIKKCTGLNKEDILALG